MESRFACFYLTRQLEWILRKFQLAEVVGGFQTTCFQLDRAASLDSTGMFYFSYDRSSPTITTRTYRDAAARCKWVTALLKFGIVPIEEKIKLSSVICRLSVSVVRV